MNKILDYLVDKLGDRCYKLIILYLLIVSPVTIILVWMFLFLECFILSYCFFNYIEFYGCIIYAIGCCLESLVLVTIILYITNIFWCIISIIDRIKFVREMRRKYVW